MVLPKEGRDDNKNRTKNHITLGKYQGGTAENPNKRHLTGRRIDIHSDKSSDVQRLWVLSIPRPTWVIISNDLYHLLSGLSQVLRSPQIRSVHKTLNPSSHTSTHRPHKPLRYPCVPRLSQSVDLRDRSQTLVSASRTRPGLRDVTDI